MTKKCCVCGDTFHASYGGNFYCSKHYTQMWRYGHIVDRTIYDKNLFIEEGNITRMVTFNKKCEASGEVLIDTEDVDKIKQYKWYISVRKSKLYCYGSIDGKKIALHRFLLNSSNIVDHINGNSLDNRKSNLREVTPQQNAYNKKLHSKYFAGIIKTNYRKDNPYMVFFSHKNKEQYLGSFPTYESAALCRLKKEMECWGEHGIHSNLYYILNHPSPIEELKKALTEGA